MNSALDYVPSVLVLIQQKAQHNDGINECRMIFVNCIGRGRRMSGKKSIQLCFVSEQKRKNGIISCQQ